MKAKDKDLSLKDVLSHYDESVEHAFSLYLFNLYVLVKVCSFAAKDEEKRKSKHLPSEDDKSFSAKIYTNEIVQSLITNDGLMKSFEDHKFEEKLDNDILKRIYRTYSEEDSYKLYISRDSTKESHVEELHELFRYCRKDDSLNEVMEDNYSSWVDDKSLVVGAVKKTIKSLPMEGAFYNVYLPDDETVDTYGRELLEKVCNEDDFLSSSINPVLENWDADRVALVDMLFIKMAVTEFLNFVTIPTKVTLNEYVELSKVYSTERSKDFINGVLDRLMKKMQDDGMIKKEGRGLLA